MPTLSSRVLNYGCMFGNRCMHGNAAGAACGQHWWAPGSRPFHKDAAPSSRAMVPMVPSSPLQSCGEGMSQTDKVSC